MSWQQLISIRQDAIQEELQERARPPLACPHDGEPLITGPEGKLFCTYDGWYWDGINR